jgi:hypothetical protein
MLTFRNKFRAFQVKALAGLDPGKRPVELSDQCLERKGVAASRGTEPAAHPFTRQKGDRTLIAA